MEEMGAGKTRPTKLWVERRVKNTREVPRERMSTPTAAHSIRHTPHSLPWPQACAHAPLIPKKEEPLDRLLRSGDP